MNSVDSVGKNGIKHDFKQRTSASAKRDSIVEKKSITSEAAKEHAENIRAIVQEEATKVKLSDQAKKLSVSNQDNLKNVTKSKFNTRKIIDKPAIFFIRGFEMIGNDGGGMKEMSDHISDGKYFSWQDEDKMIEEIMKRPPSQPVILVGHGMGSDTAVQISNTLNSASHSFKRVDLLVTLDSVGFNNDIIPQNVVKNLNYITDGSTFLSDAPNIARKTEETDVINHLSSEDHNDLIGSSDVQFKVFSSIQNAMMDKTFKNVDKEIKNN
ncbi:MAG: hypothetical protein HN576_00440 [Bacteriovoracaceae bacterium]|jgi:hypothetical protein|nr:hypothetical protein [Bacteriovoracaceae bacterium]